MAWLSGYSKRKELVLTGGASGALSDFQLKVAVPYAAAMQGDFDDIRFTQSDGTTLIDAWLEVKTNDTSATVWVEFPSTPANTVEQTYYMYYGNGSAVSDWDIRATMLDGDDFLGASLDTNIWDSQYCNTAVSGGKLTISAFSGGDRYGGGIKGKIAITPSCVIEGKMKQLATAGHTMLGLADIWNLGGTVDHQSIGFMYNNYMYGWNRNETSQSLINTTGLTVVQEYKYKIVNNGTNIAYTYDGTGITGSPITTNRPDENMYLRVGGDNLHTVSTEIDWIFARKYASGPPTYAFGSEESAPTAAIPVMMRHYRNLRL
jgi:hypothetical protein